MGCPVPSRAPWGRAPDRLVDVPAIDVANADLLLTTTKQVRKRLDLSRPVPRELLLECIDIASHAPMGGNQERNRWLIIDDPATKAEIAPLYQSVGRPYLAASAQGAQDRQVRVLESASFLVDHIVEVPTWVLAMRLDRLGDGAANADVAGYHGSVAPGVWSFQLAARARGLGSAWTTFHLVHEQQVAEILGIPSTVTQIALLPVAFYTGDSFSPAPRRPAHEITYANRWKAPVLES
jgi:nitroreductase